MEEVKLYQKLNLRWCNVRSIRNWRQHIALTFRFVGADFMALTAYHVTRAWDKMSNQLLIAINSTFNCIEFVSFHRRHLYFKLTMEKNRSNSILFKSINSKVWRLLSSKFFQSWNTNGPCISHQIHFHKIESIISFEWIDNISLALFWYEIHSNFIHNNFFLVIPSKV